MYIMYYAIHSLYLAQQTECEFPCDFQVLKGSRLKKKKEEEGI